MWPMGSVGRPVEPAAGLEPAPGALAQIGGARDGVWIHGRIPLVPLDGWINLAITAGRSRADRLSDDVELHAVDQGVVVDRSGVGRSSTECLDVRLSRQRQVGRR